MSTEHAYQNTKYYNYFLLVLPVSSSSSQQFALMYIM